MSVIHGGEPSPAESHRAPVPSTRQDLGDVRDFPQVTDQGTDTDQSTDQDRDMNENTDRDRDMNQNMNRAVDWDTDSAQSTDRDTDMNQNTDKDTDQETPLFGFNACILSAGLFLIITSIPLLLHGIVGMYRQPRISTTNESHVVWIQILKQALVHEPGWVITTKKQTPTAILTTSILLALRPSTRQSPLRTTTKLTTIDITQHTMLDPELVNVKGRMKGKQPTTTRTTLNGPVHPKPVKLIIKSDADCYRPRFGRLYHGKVNVTKEGIPCQAWAAQKPHKHSAKARRLPESTLEEARNYCRMPINKLRRPFCYTTDPNLRFQYCDVRKCD